MHAALRPLPLALAVAEKAIREFSNQWLAGLQPQLSLETGPDGQIWVHTRVAAGDVPTRALIVRPHDAAAEAQGRCQAGEAPQHHRPRRKGPSYQKRLLRRAAARAAAATADQAVQTAVETAKPADEAVQPVHPPPQVAAAEAPPPPAQPHQQNLWSVLRDELCPDTDYSTAVQAVLPRPQPYVPPHMSRASIHHIPQLDGGSTLNYQDQDEDQGEEVVWSCKCCRYEKFFDTEDDLHRHHDGPGHMLTYEECNICYPWHVWT
jgi:hypothetical protein